MTRQQGGGLSTTLLAQRSRTSCPALQHLAQPHTTAGRTLQQAPTLREGIAPLRMSAPAPLAATEDTHKQQLHQREEVQRLQQQVGAGGAAMARHRATRARVHGALPLLFCTQQGWPGLGEEAEHTWGAVCGRGGCAH